jgi:hypothetical protein
VDKPFDHRSEDVAGLGDSFDRSEGKLVDDDEAKLFIDGKLGVDKPNGGNAPNGDMDGKPNGRPQGRSIYIYKY